jgi:hypothetical protein
MPPPVVTIDGPGVDSTVSGTRRANIRRKDECESS